MKSVLHSLWKRLECQIFRFLLALKLELYCTVSTIIECVVVLAGPWNHSQESDTAGSVFPARWTPDYETILYAVMQKICITVLWYNELSIVLPMPRSLSHGTPPPPPCFCRNATRNKRKPAPLQVSILITSIFHLQSTKMHFACSSVAWQTFYSCILNWNTFIHLTWNLLWDTERHHYINWQREQ